MSNHLSIIESSSSISLKKNKETIFNKAYEAIQDYWDGLLNFRIWWYLAFSDIRRRYRRTIIGPFWTTLSLGVFLTSMGFLFSMLWKIDTKVFLPYFSSGYICLTFISSIITEGCYTFTNAEGLLKQLAIPYSSFAWLVVARNFLIFLHQILVFIVVAIIFHIPTTKYTFFIIPGFIFSFVTASWLTILLGLICARFRDIQQLVMSLLQISMFVTPIFWPQSQLGSSFKSYLLINGNILYHYVSIIRLPLLGQAPSLMNWGVVSCVTLLGWAFTMFFMGSKYRKLIFWL